MFGKAKGSSHEKDEHLPPAPQLQDLTHESLAGSDSMEISSIGPGMTVVGKISSEGTLNSLVASKASFTLPLYEYLTVPRWKAPSPHRI
jgi:hypothetical protein